MTSHRSAMTTIAVAQRATVTARCLLRPARGAREEDDPAGGARNVLERPHHLGLPPAALRLHRNRGPHPLLELALELLDEHLLVLADLDVALGDQLLTISGTHAQNLNDRHYVTPAAPADPASWPGRQLPARSPAPAPARCSGARPAPPPTRTAAPRAPPPAG